MSMISSDGEMASGDVVGATFWFTLLFDAKYGEISWVFDSLFCEISSNLKDAVCCWVFVDATMSVNE